MLVRSRAIVLHTLRYGDNKLICRVLTEREGCVTFVVRRSARRQSPHRFFQPLALLDVEWNKQSRTTMVTPRSIAWVEPYKSIPYDPQKSSVALFLCEFLQAAVKGEPAGRELFLFVEQSLRFYDRIAQQHANFHLVFLLHFAAFIGLQPDIFTFDEGAFFDLREGIFSRTRPLHPDVISPEEAAALPVLMRMTYSNMHLFKLNGAERSRLLALLCSYYQLHVPAFPAMKSLDVLREIWSK